MSHLAARLAGATEGSTVGSASWWKSIDLVSSDGLRDLDRTHGNDALDRERGSPLPGFLIIVGGITIFVGIITLLDWHARRKERRSER
jgi:hypothetical protein